jgi:GNAT superfamily N-acetyltransferase
MQKNKKIGGNQPRNNNLAFSRSDILENLEVRSFDPKKDLQNALELNKSSVLNSAIGRLWNDDWNISVNYIKEAYQGKRGDFFTVYFQNQLIAMGGLQEIDGQKAIIKKFRVHPDFRGLGLAKLLVEKCEERAAELNYKIVRGDVNEENFPMQKLMLEKGYSFIEKINEFSMTMFVYEKILH